jgi:hypothetical protein
LIARYRADFEIVNPDEVQYHRRGAEPDGRRVRRLDSRSWNMTTPTAR